MFAENCFRLSLSIACRKLESEPRAVQKCINNALKCYQKALGTRQIEMESLRNFSSFSSPTAITSTSARCRTKFQFTRFISSTNHFQLQPDSDASEVANSAIKNFARRIAKVFRRSHHSQDGSTSSHHSAKPYSDIPGPKGLPLFGSALSYTALGKFSPKEYDKALRHRHNKYGKIFRERILNDDFIYISDPDDIRLLVQNEGASPCRPHLEAIYESRKQEGLPVGITSMQGEEWLRNRNSINPAISLPKIVQKFRQPQQEIAKDLVKYITEMRHSKTGEVPKFDQILNNWALESIAVVLLDTRLGLLHPDSSSKNSAADKLRKCMDIFFDYGARLTFGMPFWKLWNTRDWKIFRNSQRDEFKYAGYFVEKKLKELNQDSKPKPSFPKSTGCPFHHQGRPSNKSFRNLQHQTPSCLLDHVINNSELSKEEAVTVCLELLAGGIDTTAAAAVFTLYQLAVNQDHQEYLRSLLRKEEETGISHEEYNREKSEFSKYLKACVWESMRLNPLTYANVRTTEKNLVFSGYQVPAGTTVRYTSHLMNLSSDEYYLDANKFIPERFLHRNSPYRCKKQFVYTPFGHGARQCPGRRIAEQELDLLFREILSVFRFGYKHGKMGVKVRLFNQPDKPAAFNFAPINQADKTPQAEEQW